MRAADGNQGILLILVSGVVGLSLLVALALLHLARSGAAAAAATVSRSQALLAAEGGLEYAASRLPREGQPRFSTVPEDRGDDWAFRQGALAPLRGAQNPSYAHGASWTDVQRADGIDNDGDGQADEPDEGDGVWGPADPRGPGRGAGDGIGAPSGRLRGSASASFSLKIGTMGGRLPLNAGHADSLDRNAPGADGYDNDWDGAFDEADEAGLAVPDHRDPDLPIHRGLIHALNNLGAILRPMDPPPAIPWTRRADVPAGIDSDGDGDPDGEPIEISWLGYDLVRRRPRGGYRSELEVRETLLAEGYRAGEIDLFLPFLDLGRGSAVARRARTGWLDDASPGDPPLDPGIEALVAPDAVLASLWRYVSGPLWGLPGFSVWGARYTRSGPANLIFRDTDANGIVMVCTIFPDEADALAREARALIREGDRSWRGLRRRLWDRAPSIFARDFADLAAGMPVPPLMEMSRAGWVRSKSDLAFFAVSPDPYPWNPHPAGWATWGLDADDALGGTQPFSALLCRYVATAAYPYPMHAATYPPGSVNLPYRWDPPGGAGTFWPDSPPTGIPLIAPLSVTLASPSRFRVSSIASAGEGSALVEGDLLCHERLDLCSQQDLDAVDFGTLGLERQGIRAADAAPAERCAWLTDPASGRRYPHATSFPHLHSTAGLRPLSSCYGGVALAGREMGPWGASLYWSFREDLDGDASNDFWGEPAGPPFSTQLPIDPPAAANSSTPWGIRRTPSLGQPFECPVLKGAGFAVSGPLSIEAWILPTPLRGVGSKARSANAVTGTGGPVLGTVNHVMVNAVHEASSPQGPGVRLVARVSWPTGPMVPGLLPLPPETSFEVFVPDYDLATGGSVQGGFYHVVLALEPGAERTHVRLFVNGAQAGEGDWPAAPRILPLKESTWTRLYLEGADEVRFHQGLLADIPSRYRAGRFSVPRGPASPDPGGLLALLPAEPPNPTYRSPRYECLEGTMALRSASWNGFSSPEAADRVGMRAVVYGYDGSGGLLGWVDLPEPGAAADLSALGPVRSFRYAVEFFSPTGAPPAGPLLETPVFESIWISLQRAGRSPAWSSWSAR